MVAEPRHVARDKFTAESRIILLEQDADRHDRDFEAFKQEMRSEVRQIKGLGVGVMVSATTATIVGAINLFFGRLGG